MVRSRALTGDQLVVEETGLNRENTMEWRKHANGRIIQKLLHISTVFSTIEF